MGKPVLGENCRLEVIIEESYDFKVTFWGPSFLESFPWGGSRRNQLLGWGGQPKGGVARGPRPSSHPSASTMDSNTPFPLLAMNRAVGGWGPLNMGCEPQPQCSAGSLGVP